MDVALDLLRTLNLGFGALALGAAVYEAALILPTVRSLAAVDGYALLRTLKLHPARPAYRYLPLSGIASGIAAGVIVVLWNEQPQNAALLTAVGLVLFLGAAAMNVAYWSLGAKRLYEPAAAPDDEVLRRLAARNLWRAALYAAGFVVFALAAAVD